MTTVDHCKTPQCEYNLDNFCTKQCIDIENGICKSIIRRKPKSSKVAEMELDK